MVIEDGFSGLALVLMVCYDEDKIIEWYGNSGGRLSSLVLVSVVCFAGGENGVVWEAGNSG